MLLVFRPIEKMHLAMADQCSDQKSCHTGEGRCPWQNWVPAFAGKTRRRHGTDTASAPTDRGRGCLIAPTKGPASA